MASRLIKFAGVATAAALCVGGYLAYMARAAQAQGELAQAPLNVQSSVTPAFIMAIDDSGSMTYHNQFPGADGKACWSRDDSSQPWSFFITSGPNAGDLRTVRPGRSDCNSQAYSFSYGASPRNGESSNWRGIPPVDTFGFARSPDFNPAYFDPTVTYEPWVNSNGESFGNASLTDTRIDPRPNGSGLGTVNLTADLYETRVSGSAGQVSDRFNAYQHMVLPAGTEYRTESWWGCGGLAGGGEWRTLASDHAMTATCEVFIKHRLATFYLRGDEVPPGYESVPRTVAENACGPGCDMWRYDIQPDNTEALQNFANWFSYYGNRHRALIAGLTLSFANVNKLRAGYFRISQRNSYDEPAIDSDTATTERVHMRDMADPDDKEALYDLMFANPAWSSTFNRQAVNAAGQQFRRRDSIDVSPRGGAPVQLACQKNAIMLFTDGYSNNNSVSVGNVDSGMGVPFADDHSNTLADIATRYYLNDEDGRSPIRPDITPAGLAPVDDGCPSSDPKKNCQTNLHVNFYGVTLNGRGDLYDPDNPRDPYTDPAVYNNWPEWENDSRSTIDDIWHATVNTRGRLINARTPADIRGAIRDILSSLTAGSASSGTSSVTGARISERSLSVAPGYGATNSGTSWYGTLVAFKPELDLTSLEVSETEIWRAEETLTDMSAATRRNHTWFGTGSGASKLNETNITNLQRFCDNPRPGMSRCTGSELAALGVDVASAINYLLGDASQEVRNGGTLRDRIDESGDPNVLGDIVNSTPIISAPTDDYGYRGLGTVGGVNYGSTYNTYMTTKQARPAMVYVGANDGMLHGFHGGIDHEGTLDAANAGRQMLAYIPRAVLGHMGNLLFRYDPDAVGQKFDHRYFVDGPVAVGDAYFDGGWKTALVATAGAGGRSVFALDVSDPSNFTSSANLLWEIDDQHSDITVRENIGHVLGRPVIVPFREPGASGAVSWKAIFGNGYNSVRNRAVLFVVDLGTGAVRMIEAEEDGAPAGRNGLGNIVVVDSYDSSTSSPRLAIRDGFADTVYAADRKGAIWKFDLLSSASSIDTPLFTTREHSEGGTTYRQPILGGLVATAGRGGGVMLMFGTGSFSFDGDAGDESIQSIYGIEDNGSGSTITRSDLFPRSIVVDGTNVRTITPGGMSYGYRGWYIDLPAGERVVSYPRVASGVLFMPTYAPTEADGCSTGGENWLFGLDTRTGAPALESVRFGDVTGETQGDDVGAVALTTGGSSPVRDVGVQVVSTSKPIVPAAGSDPLPRCWMRITVPGMSDAMFVPYPCGRQSWRQLQ